MTATTRAPKDPRVIALRNFAISITVFNIVGYSFLGFEQPALWPVLALLTAYATEMALEVIGARGEDRPPRFAGRGVRGYVEFLYPAHITALAVNMLLYVNDRVGVMLLGVIVAISGKWLLRAPVNGRLRHFMNPSNFGISVVLLVFHWVSIAPPYHFTENLHGWADWIVPVVIVIGGTMLNGKLTKRMWLIAGWLSVFVAQAVVRGLVLHTAIPSALGIMTGAAFILFTNYMVTDPGTTPTRPLSQFAFGGGVAFVYALLTGASIVYGLFFATAIVCAVRGGFLWSLHIVREQERRRAEVVRPESPAVRQQPAREPAVAA
ncbi:enediyne biosynthesis protein [Dactylosporangium sp. CA-139066]|uniref:enediyne biosynthesis protein n=1 Tax=Dactylosporangium sp. CA-139066 TaxID=3239930 RepID=UPI003D8EF296